MDRNSNPIPDRAELIARLRECKYSSLAAMYAEQAADMLEADGKVAEPQWTCWCDENNLGEPGVSCGDCPRDYAKTVPQPQRPRLSDGEVYTAYIEATNQTLRPQDERLALAFARAIEKKVRGEA